MPRIVGLRGPGSLRDTPAAAQPSLGSSPRGAAAARGPSGSAPLLLLRALALLLLRCGSPARRRPGDPASCRRPPLLSWKKSSRNRLPLGLKIQDHRFPGLRILRPPHRQALPNGSQKAPQIWVAKYVFYEGPCSAHQNSLEMYVPSPRAAAPAPPRSRAWLSGDQWSSAGARQRFGGGSAGPLGPGFDHEANLSHVVKKHHSSFWWVWPSHVKDPDLLISTPT